MKLNEILAKIDENQQKIDGFGKFDPEILKRINYKFRLDWNYYSNRMEGGTLTREETRSVMIGNVDVKGKPLKDVLEMNGHDQVVLDILKIAKGEMRISEKRIKDIHKAIMYEDNPEKAKQIGQWKLNSNELLNYRGEKIVFTAPADVKDEIHELLNRTNGILDSFFQKKSTKHPLEIASDFHIDFVSIHPFYDGNGRTTRILMNLLLVSMGFPPIIIKDQVKDSYGKLLADIQVYGGQRDLFIAFIGERLLESQQIMLNALEGNDIEEEDDLYKEIDLWKKNQTKEKSNVLSKNNKIVYDSFEKSLKNLFDELFDKHELFRDMFHKTVVYNKLNNYNQITTKYSFIEKWINTSGFFIKKVATTAFAKFLQITDLYDLNPADLNRYSGVEEVNEIQIQILYQGYLHNGSDTFDSALGLTVVFDQFHYIIFDRLRQKEILRKLYSESLSKKEISEIIHYMINELFAEIKRRTDQKK